MKSRIKRISACVPAQLKYLFSCYFSGMVVFSVYRTIELYSYRKEAMGLPQEQRLNLIMNSMLMGLRFDNVISSYLLVLPFLILSVLFFLKIKKDGAYRAVNLLVFALYSTSFLAFSADVPYFRYYYSRLNVAIFNWSSEKGFMFRMITEEFSYLAFVILFLALCISFYFLLKKFLGFLLRESTGSGNSRRSSWAFILTALLMFLGARGRIEIKSPIRVGTAYFSEYALPNQLGLNPAFTFIQSAIEAGKGKSEELHLMPDNEAIANARSYFGIKGNRFGSPMARLIPASGKELNANVVLVIMESMTDAKLTRYGCKKNLTPNLDSLQKSSLSFDNFYSAGIHTYNGIFSSLYSYPALLNQHPMKRTIINKYDGLPNILKGRGYSSYFFVPHDDQFDNIAGFMYSNGFERVISQKDYPQNLVLSTLGVPDHVLFEKAMPYLNGLAKRGRPFFAGFMTASDHGPYIVPQAPGFHSHSSGIRDRVVEYADYSIGHFLKMAKSEPWFKNTIFVFVADHGANIAQSYDMPLSFNHIPLIIYSPGLIKNPHFVGALGGQIDIGPTVLGLLNIPYLNNGMGIDILKETRPYIYFSADDKIGCIGKDYFWVDRLSTKSSSLYYYRTLDQTDYSSREKKEAANMKAYAFSMLQVAQYMNKHALTSVHK